MRSKAQEMVYQVLKSLGIVGVTVAAALGGLPALAQQLGQCVRVELDAPVALPDGSVQEVGLLRLCLDRRMNPAEGIHEVEVDGAGQLAVSRIDKAEADVAAGAVVVFERDRNGQLRLIGYAVPDGDRMVTFTLKQAGKRDDALRAGSLLEQPVEDGRIMIAARRSR